VTTPAAGDARLLAFHVLARVERSRAFADLALRAALDRSPLEARDRALATELVYGTLRWRGRLDYELDQVLDSDLARLEPAVRTLLRLGAYQLRFVDRVPDHAAVNESVRCARALGLARASGLINAVLRRLSGPPGKISLPTLEADPVRHLVDVLSIPTWVAERWLRTLGADEAAALALASNQVAPLTVRANRTRASRETLLEKLLPRFPGARPCRLAPDGIRLEPRVDPARDPGFQAGDFTVQDEASQLVVELLDPAPGERILDACAAPGTKTTAIAERVGATGQVLAVDRSARRLVRLERDKERLGLSRIQTRVADAREPLPHGLADAGFQRILVDAPCSGLGTLRRNPDTRWRVRPGDLAGLARTQLALLQASASLLGPGGTLVYSTCTLFPEENELVVQKLLATNPGLRIVPGRELPEALAGLAGPEGFVRTLPHRHDADGFFMARLERLP
jgi:16S rRNA (cytosine967-C5)-methyltransferase